MTATIELLLIFMLILAITAKPLGAWMAPMALCEAPTPLKTLDARLMRFLGINAARMQTPSAYLMSLLAFNAMGFFVLWALLVFQGFLPLNPAGIAGMDVDQAFNTAASFVTNTNWQSYAGETGVSILSQMMGLTVQNFVSAATGIAVAFALMRALTERSKAQGLGNFFADIVRINVWILLPLSILWALIFMSQGVPQTFEAHTTLMGLNAQEQTLSMGPVASQEAIKLLGTNGGGFFNANSAHPFENPTALTNFFQCLAIFIISSALLITFGHVVRDVRQGYTLWAAVAIIFVVAVLCYAYFEAQAGHYWVQEGGAMAAQNMEGKEMRFSLAHNSLFSAVTTSASCGAVNNMHDSLSPMAGAVTALLILLGEIVFGGVGSGFYGLIVFVLVAVFIACLMVGKTPQYLGKKVGAQTMKYLCAAMLVTPVIVLVGTSASLLFDPALQSLTQHAPHGLTQLLYAWGSAANNNGSAFAGLSADTYWYNIGLGLAMLGGRFLIIAAIVAGAGTLLGVQVMAKNDGTLKTHGVLFAGLLIAVIILIGLLTYLPLTILGPMAEHLTIWGVN